MAGGRVRILQVPVRMSTEVVHNVPCGTAGGVVLDIETVEVVYQLAPHQVWQTVKNYSENFVHLFIQNPVHHGTPPWPLVLRLRAVCALHVALYSSHALVSVSLCLSLSLFVSVALGGTNAEVNQMCSTMTLQEIFITKFSDLDEIIKEKLQTIHYWINNAGINGGRRPFSTLSTGTLEAVVRVNLIGILLCTKVAMDIMQAQDGVTSHVFQTVGSGVKGGGTPGYVAYGATKRGLPQMVDSIVAELTKGVPGFEVDPPPGTVNVHTLSPGMVFTDLLLDDSTPELRKFPFGVLAAQPDEVGEDLVPKILATSGNGKSVEFLTTDKVLTKFFEKFILGKKSEYIDDDGNVIKMPGAQYETNGVRKLY